MHLTMHHRFDAPLEAVLETLVGAEYPRFLAANHSFFAAIEPLALETSPTHVARSLRYRARPFITRLGVFSLPASWFVWVEQSRLDLARARLTFDNVPEVESVRDKVVNRGVMQFRTQRGESGRFYTVRESRFELALEVAPLYRPLADAALGMVARQLGSSLDEEARLLARWLAAGDDALALSA